MNYRDFPLIKFCMIIHDKSMLKEYGISEKDWEAIEREYTESIKDEKRDVLMDAYGKTLSTNAKLNKLLALMQFIIKTGDDWKPYFKKCNVKYNEDPLKNLEYLDLQIKKARTKDNIETQRYLKLKKELKENQEKIPKADFDLEKVYDSISSLELCGFTINDYEKLTCGKYRSMLTALRANNKRNSVRNNNR